MGLFYFMAIEKRFYNSEAEEQSFLTCFKMNNNYVRIHMEDFKDYQFVDLDADELRELICDLNFILKEINETDELH